MAMIAIRNYTKLTVSVILWTCDHLSIAHIILVPCGHCETLNIHNGVYKWLNSSAYVFCTGPNKGIKQLCPPDTEVTYEVSGCVNKTSKWKENNMLHNLVKMVVVVMIFHQPMHIIVNVLIHIRVFIVRMKRNYVLDMHVVIEHRTCLQHVLVIHRIKLFFTLARVSWSTLGDIWVILSKIVIVKNSFLKNVKERNLLTLYHLPIKPSIFVIVVMI